MRSPNEPRRHVLIVTVGQTRAPIEIAITELLPDGVVFVASQQSHTVAAELISQLPEGISHHTLLLRDPEDLQESYEKGREALEQALAWEAQAITADLTGGTKPMVAGATLALSGRGVTFSYVGGEKRDDYGRVQSGHERLRLLEDPATRLHLREWEGFVRAWNGGRFPEAESHLQQIRSRPLRRSEASFYERLQGVTLALDAWDAFYHERSLELLRANLDEALAIAEAWRHGGKVRVLQQLLEHRERLTRLVETGASPSRLLLADLLANAEHRAEMGRFDDAVARLYRAVELAAEVDIASRHQIILREHSTLGKLSPELREQARRMRGLKETLELAFAVDLYFGKRGTLAQQLSGDYNTTLKPLLEVRHESVLAHGTKPVSASAYSALRDYLLRRDLRPAPAWPKW